MDMMGVGLDLMAVFLTFVIMIGVLLGKKNSMNEYFPIMLLMNALALLADLGTLAFAQDVEHIIMLRAFWILQFSFLFCGIAGFNLYVDTMISRKSQKKPMIRIVPFVIVAIMIVLWITSLQHGLIFRITEDGTMIHGRFFWITELVGCGIAVFDLARVLVNQLLGKLDTPTAKGIYIFIMLPLAALLVMELIGSPAILLAAITISYLTMYISIHVRREQAMLEREADNEKMQTELIMSQIQPHFIYNSLTTIKYLCNSNPHLADEAITKFTKYLRRNLDTVSNYELVRFKDELEHTKTYLWLEQLRFGKNLNVVYSIDNEQFMIPPLSVQPIVENAVKHGVTKKIGGGTVTIAVRETEHSYRIVISDDGVGFNQKKMIETKRAHVGIEDVRKRIAQINGSTLKVNSEEGVGTSVVYEIIKDE